MRRTLVVVACLLVVLTVAVHVIASRVLASDYTRNALEQQLTSRLGQPVRIGTLKAAVYPRVAVDLGDVTIGEPAAITLAHVRVVTGLRALFSRRIADAELVLRNSRLTLPLPVSLLPANAAPGTTTTGAGLTIASVRVVSLENVELVAPPHVLRIDLDASIVGDRHDIKHLSARGQSSRIDGTGAISSMSRIDGTLEARADPLDLDELMAIASALTTTTGGAAQKAGGATPMHLTIALTATNGQFAAYTFSDLSTTTQLTNGRVTLAPLAVRTFGGRFNGQLDADTRGSVPQLHLSGRVEGLDVSTLMKANGVAGGITGTLGGTVSLTALGSDASTVLQTAHGTIAAAVTNGTIEHLDLVRTVVLAFGKPSGVPPEGSGSAFTRVAGTFALAKQTLTSSDLSLTSRDFDVNGRTTFQLSTGALDARGDVTLSRELTAQSGTDLRRYAQQDGRVVVPATVSGTIQNPRVAVDVQAAAARAFQNEIKRRARTLFEGILKKK